MTQTQLIKIVSRNKDLYEICKRLKNLSKVNGINTNQVIAEMNLPISKHLFLTANYYSLMALEYK